MAERSEMASDSSSRDRDDDMSSDDAEASASVAKNACDDGTCTSCGAGHCPIGWYCDESAKGGPACGWLPECTKKPSCACLKRILGGSCEERGAGLYVTSD